MPFIKQNQEKVAAGLVSPSRHSCQLWSRALAATGVVAAAWTEPGLGITEVMIAAHRSRPCSWCFRYVSLLVPQLPCKVGLTLSYPYFIKVKGTAEVELTTPGFEPGQSDFSACALVAWLCWPSRARRILRAARLESSRLFSWWQDRTVLSLLFLYHCFLIFLHLVYNLSWIFLVPPEYWKRQILIQLGLVHDDIICYMVMTFWRI